MAAKQPGMLRVLVSVLLLCAAAVAQDKTELLRAYRNEWSGYPLTAAVFDRYVDVQADADWWSYLVTNPRRKSYLFVDIAGSLVELANNLGWGDAKTLNSNAGGQADAPPVLEIIDSWKGKMGIKIVLPSGLKPEQKEVLLDNVAILNGPISSSYNVPRGGKFFLNLTFNAKATEATGKCSKDGTTFDFVFPIYANVYTSQIENVLKKGLK